MKRRSGSPCGVLGAVVLVTIVACGESPEAGEGASLETLQQAVVTGPDFVVGSLTGPTSARPTGGFKIQVKVCNQGTEAGNASVEFYLSSDTIITPRSSTSPLPDHYAGDWNTGYLEPGYCRTATLPISPSVPTEGAWYVGAVVDPFNAVPEVSETNNSKTGPRMGIGDKPDFVVSSLSAPPSAQLQQTFATTVTVCNQGTQNASTHVGLYLSLDPFIPPNTLPGLPPDLLVGQASTSDLAPSQCQTLSLYASPSLSTSGVWYLGATADPQGSVAELIENNNSKLGSRMGFGSLLDFVVTSIGGPTGLLPSQQFTASVTVCNQGTSQEGDT